MDADLQKAQACEIPGKQSYDSLQTELGSLKRGRSGVKKAVRKAK